MTEKRIETKQIKHVFSREEKEKISQELVEELRKKVEAEAEAKQAATGFKARVAEHETRIGTLTTNHSSGFEMRMVKCEIVLKPAERKKYYYRTDKDDFEPALVEEMRSCDYEQDLPFPTQAATGVKPQPLPNPVLPTDAEVDALAIDAKAKKPAKKKGKK